MPATRDLVAQRLRELDDRLAFIGGCGDGGCVIVKPKGQHTNGGCRCTRNPHTMQWFAHEHNKFADAIRALDLDIDL